MLSRPVAIEVRDLEKTFWLPTHRIDTLKERVARPLSRPDYRELRALRGASFDVHQGEFFGIVGRNGSGKSTLLKILASIYRADSGAIRMRGRLAPFIELGVGFNMDLTARENVTLNGVMMGLSRREAQGRLDAVLEFAELESFVDLKLKNYSSGMLVRLAFAVMVEADADIMLVDEVLAVGDASFARKCMDVFREKRRVGKTIVLVTHDMATVQSLCDRAMMLHEGELVYLGDPEETALRYFRTNFHRNEPGVAPTQGAAVPDVNVRLVDVWLENEAGERVDNVEQDTPIVLNLVVEARQDLSSPGFNFHFLNADDVWVFGFSKTVEGAVPAGQRIEIAGPIENRLVPGRYSVECWASRAREQGDVALQVLRLLDFYVYGTKPGAGSVWVDSDVDVFVEQGTSP